MKRFLFHSLSGILVIVFLACSSCGRSAPSRFYTLNPVPHPTETNSKAGKGCIVVGIDPVGLPPYLDRPQIVSVIDQNEFAVGEFDKWVEPLKDNFSNVLAENLSAMLSNQPIIVLSSRAASSPAYRVKVDVIRLDGVVGKSASLIARWTLFEEKRKRMMFVKRSVYTEPVEGKDYKALVATQSRLVEALSRDIAAEIKNLHSK